MSAHWLLFDSLAVALFSLAANDPPDADRALAARLESVRLARAADQATDRKTSEAYLAAFRDTDLNPLQGTPAQTAARLAKSPQKEQLIAALDDWLAVTDREEQRKALLAVLLRADPDPWRTRLRQALTERDAATLKRLAADEAVARQSPVLLAHLGAGLRRNGAAEAAVALLRQAQRQHPGDLWINLELAEALRRLQPPRDEEAVRYLTAAVALRPDNASLLVRLGSALAARGELDEAVACLRQAIRLDPASAAAHNELGLVCLRRKQFDEAIAAFRAAISLNPMLPGPRVNLGEALLARGQTDEAIACLREALRIDPQGDVRPLLHLADVLRLQGKPDEAEKMLRDAIRLQPDNADGHRRLGDLLREQGKLDEATAAYRQAIRLQPDNYQAMFGLGGVLLAQKRLPEAEATFREVIRLKPDFAPAHRNLGVVLSVQGKLPESEAAFRQAIHLQPDSPEAHLDLARVLVEVGKLAEALAALDRVVALRQRQVEEEPANVGRRHGLAAALNERGIVLVRLGRIPEGNASFRRAIDLEPDEERYHANLALALRMQGDLTGARAELRKAVELTKDKERRERYEKLLKELEQP
jgi:tetratricopeptide (TPR) repeat protein